MLKHVLISTLLRYMHIPYKAYYMVYALKFLDCYIVTFHAYTI